MRAMGALAVAALVLAGGGCGDDGDDGADGVDADQGVEDEAVEQIEVDDEDQVLEDEAVDDSGAGDGRPSLDDLTDDQAAYAQDVCERADSWVRGTTTPSTDELTVTGNALSAGQGGPLLEQLGPDLQQITDPAAGMMTYENLVIVCTAYQQGS